MITTIEIHPHIIAHELAREIVITHDWSLYWDKFGNHDINNHIEALRKQILNHLLDNTD